MKRLSILAVFMLISVITFAQQALWGSQNIISPEIHPDNTVTFRFMAHRNLFPPNYIAIPLLSMD